MNDALNLFDQFHFLRPLWLLGIALLPLLYLLAKRANQHHSSWSQAISPQLLKYLLDDSQQTTKKWPLTLFITTLVLCLLALAGPVWKKIPQPVHQTDNALVIVLDQSLSMLATDLKPSRQVTVKHKLTDLLKARQEGQTALLVYAGDAHIVSPLTDDTNTILAMVPALSPVIMPALGSRVASGIELAIQALRDGGINKGQILLITDGIQISDIGQIRKSLQGSAHRLAIMAVGSADGGPIPIPDQGLLRDKGEIVIARTNISLLRQLAQATAAPISALSLDDADLNTLLPDPAFDLNKSTHQVEREMDQWHEEGPWLILLILPFATLAFRRGWLLSLLFVVMIQPEPVEAADWSEQLWKTVDQQGAQAFDKKDYAAAQRLFKSKNWQGSAAYRAGDYQTAAELFAQSDEAAAHYNRGNALAQQGQLEESIKAYDEALKRDPDFADAKSNKAVIEALAKQQQSQSSKNNSDDKQNADQDQQSSENQEGQQSQGDDQQSEDQQSQDQPSQSNDKSQQQKVDDEQADQASEQGKASKKKEQQAQQQSPSDKESGENDEVQQASQTVNEASPLSEEEQQAMEQWLRRIPDDPSALLKRKFNYQYQQNRKDNQYVPQQENEAIW